jgi:hypothetical protein
MADARAREKKAWAAADALRELKSPAVQRRLARAARRKN